MIPPVEHRYALFPLFLASVCFLVLAPVFWMYTELPSGDPRARSAESADLYGRVYPAMDYGFGRMRAGEIPLWNPYILCGTPFTADPVNGLWQPLNAVFLLTDTARGMALQAFVCLALGGTTFVLYARSLGLGNIAGFIAGMSWAFGGTFAGAMSRPELAATLAWTPLFFCVLREFIRYNRLAMAVMAGVTGALIALAGSFPAAVSIFLLATLFCLYRQWLEDPAYGTRWRGYTLMILLVLGLSAVQWLPAAARLVQLDQPGQALWRLDFAAMLAPGMRGLVRQWVTTSAEALPRAGYAGLVPMLLLPAAMFHRTARGDAFFFLAAGLLLYPVAVLGRPVWSGTLPFEALFFPASFCMAAAAAIGADRLLAGVHDRRSPNLWIPALLLVLLATILFVASTTAGRGLVLLHVIVLGFAWLTGRKWSRTSAGIATAMLLFVDLAMANANFDQHPYTDAPAVYRQAPAALKTAEEQALDGRVVISTRSPGTALTPNAAMVLPLPAANGRHVPLTRDEARWWSELRGADAAPGSTEIAPSAARPELLNFMAARVVLAESDAPMAAGKWEQGTASLRRVQTEDAAKLFVNDRAQRRCFWVPRWRVQADVGSAILFITRSEFDPAQECVVVAPGALTDHLARVVPDSGGGDTGAEPGAECILVEDLPERQVIQLRATHPGIAVVCDSYAPGWRATLNGESVPLLQVNGLFRGIACPAGDHEIVLEYRPHTHYAGMGISVGVLGLLLLAGLFRLVRGT